MERDDEVTFWIDEQRRRGFPQRDSRQARRPGRSRWQGVLGATRRNDPCPCGSGRAFKRCCMKSGRFDGSPRGYYRRDW